MKKILLIFVITILLGVLTSCIGNAPISKPATDTDTIATTVAGTLTAFPSAIPSTTPTLTAATPEPISLCRFGATSFPGITHFTPVDGRGAIAYSSDYLLDGLTLTFPDSGEIIPLQQLRKQGLVGATENISWSPDGTKIAFWYSEAIMSGKGYLMLADLPLGEVCAITENIHYIGTPIWSTDGGMLAFIDNESAQLKVLTLSDGAELTVGENILFSPVEALPMWADSKHIVYIRNVRITETEFITDLVNQPLDGSAPTIILENISGLRDFSFSPDGKWLAYSVSGNIVLRNLETDIEQDLGGDLFNLYWSPDSNYLLGKAGLSAIWLIQPNSSDQITMLNFYGCLGNEPWAADSQRFALLLCADGSKSSKIAVYDLTTMELQELPLPVEELSPSFPAWNNH